MVNYSPLRYPGGKNKLSDYVKEIYELNQLHGNEYLEPFAGGAGVALSLLLSEHVYQIHINDIDKGIYAFWHSVLNETDELCKLIHDTEVTIENWRKFREDVINVDELSTLELGFRTFFLNRTNRSGIIKAGVIGGVEQKGKWKLDARYSKESLINRIQTIGFYKQRIQLDNLDVLEFLRKKKDVLKKPNFIYFDPPYYIKAQELYQNHFGHEDHDQLSQHIQKLEDVHWMVSYDAHPEILSIYESVDTEVFNIRYSADKHYEGSEAMFFANSLKRPSQVYTSRQEKSKIEKELLEAEFN